MMVADASPPFLESEPPLWAARGLAFILLAFFVAGITTAVALQIPETVRGQFILAPIDGTDPVRSLRDGVVADVRAVEGSLVAERSTLFVIRSPNVGDRSAELAALRARLDGNSASALNARRQYESERLADESEARRLAGRVEYLTGLLPLKQEQLSLARKLTASYETGKADGAVSEGEYARVALEANRLAEEVRATERDVVETRAALEKHRLGMATRASQFAEVGRALSTARDEAAIRASALESDVGRGDGNALPVLAPCAGTVVRLRVNAPGAVVREGDVLAEVACGGQRLRAEMTDPQSGMALLKAGQSVKLRYDAFPFQRYGARSGVVRWLGPVSARGDSAGFRAFIDVDSTTIRVHGDARPLVVGMGGRADVVVGRRSLISYAFEPLRQLRQSVSP
jgi:membrane fusion protein